MHKPLASLQGVTRVNRPPDHLLPQQCQELMHKGQREGGVSVCVGQQPFVGGGGGAES